MEEIKKYIASKIFEAVQNPDILLDDIYAKIEVPKEKSNGDFAYPCFMLAKVLRNSPINIANDIKSKIKLYTIHNNSGDAPDVPSNVSAAPVVFLSSCLTPYES